ncbi:ribosomal protein L4 [Acrasis kona]|uniref:Large ribosomal subunit protein uL4 n=1 Tax=Acrasis kona TaxID=1008807 RepID=A0AAW2ZMH4_9EUKA
MALNRPQVSVFNYSNPSETKGQAALPDVFNVPIRTDLVNVIHNFLRMNRRQPYAVNFFTGHQHSAESWGTGRAVSRIPRVSGGGTHRAGQGAFGNMCRSGRMFAPTKTWRRWMHQIKKNERRYATASAIAASSVTGLVLARGHRAEQVRELPLVVTDELQSIKKTKEAVNFLKGVGAYPDVRKVLTTKKVRPGKGKARNRRYLRRRGPLVVYKNNSGLTNAFRNLPGVDTISVDRLTLLQLAPGGHVGRLIIWTESAFNALNERFGSYDGVNGATNLKGRNGQAYKLHRPVMVNTDVERIIQSDAVQNVVRPRKLPAKRRFIKRNPLKSLKALNHLNPYATKQERLRQLRARRAASKATTA